MDNILNLISLATKAGKVVSGEFSVEKAIKAGKAKLVIVADDASDNTKKKFSDKCSFYNINFAIYSDKDGLGRAMGKEMRSSVAVLDDGFMRALLKKMDGGNEFEDKRACKGIGNIK